MTTVILLLLLSSRSQSGVDIPSHLFTENGTICLRSHDGCNSCGLTFFDGRLAKACTQKACFPSLNQPEQCTHEVSEDYFSIPKIDGKVYSNCSSLIFQNKTCKLNYRSDPTQEHGFSWQCEPNQLLTQLSKPICAADLKGRLINESTLSRLEESEQQKQRSIRQEKKNAKKICLEWKDPCRNGRNFVYPPQTKFDLSVAKFNTGRKQCKAKHPDYRERRTCTSEIRYGDIPAISYENTQSWFSRQPMILEDNCVRYDNECRAYYLVLHQNRGTKELTWQWQLKVKSCPKSIYKQKIKETMRCTSFYKPQA